MPNLNLKCKLKMKAADVVDYTANSAAAIARKIENQFTDPKTRSHRSNASISIERGEARLTRRNDSPFGSRNISPGDSLTFASVSRR